MKRKAVKLVSDSLTRALSGQAPEELGNLETPEVPETDTSTEVTPSVDTVVTPEASKEEPVVVTVKEVEPKPDPLVNHLKSELKEVRAENTELTSKLLATKAELDKLTSKLETSESFGASATTAVRQMTERLSIGLGMKPVGLDTASGENLMMLWASVKAQFDKQFLSGGKSSVGASEAPDTKDTSVQQTRRVKATQLS